MRITRAAMDAAWRRRAPATRLVIGDSQVRGLALVVNATSMRWLFSYKPRGVNAVSGARPSSGSVTLGTPAAMSVDDARSAAARLKDDARAGGDPAADRRRGVAQGIARRAATVPALLPEYGPVLAARTKMRGTGRLSPRAVADELQKRGAIIDAMDMARRRRVPLDRDMVGCIGEPNRRAAVVR